VFRPVLVTSWQHQLPLFLLTVGIFVLDIEGNRLADPWRMRVRICTREPSRPLQQLEPSGMMILSLSPKTQPRLGNRFDSDQMRETASASCWAGYL